MVPSNATAQSLQQLLRAHLIIMGRNEMLLMPLHVEFSPHRACALGQQEEESAHEAQCYTFCVQKTQKKVQEFKSLVCHL